LSSCELTHFNITVLKYPYDSPEVSGFVNNLDRINQVADNSEGFVWRLEMEEDDTSDIDIFGKDSVVNMSVWENIEHLHNYVYRTAHAQIMRRKKEWFHKKREAALVLWWVPKGHRPSLKEADAKLQKLRNTGPTQSAFSFKHAFPMPNEAVSCYGD